MNRITVLVVLGLFLAGCAPATVTPGPTTSPTLTPAPPTAPAAATHVFIVVMENKSYDQVWDPAAAPYINSLGSQYARATSYHAITHPSLPNYLHLYAGSNYDITTNCSPSSSCHIDAVSLADNLEAKGLSWKGYMDAMPSPCYLKTSGNYAPRHNPFIYFDAIRNDTDRCNSHVVPYTSLSADLASASTTPNFVWISPDVCNDMHDCSISTGDTWLKNNIPPILASPACTLDRCLLILTWDEDDNHQDNHVLTIFAGSMARTGGVTSAAAYNHYSALRTVEDIFGLAPQTPNDAEALPMMDLLQ